MHLVWCDPRFLKPKYPKVVKKRKIYKLCKVKIFPVASKLQVYMCMAEFDGGNDIFSSQFGILELLETWISTDKLCGATFCLVYL